MEIQKNTAIEATGRRTDTILQWIRTASTDDELRVALDEYHHNDIASVLLELTDDERERLHRALDSDTLSDVISYLDEPGEYLTQLNTEEAANIIENMEPNEALEALDELDIETREVLLAHIEDEEIKQDISLLDSYDDATFGSKMSTNFIAVSKNESIKGAMRILISEAAEKNNIHTIFAVEEDGIFFGAIDLKALIVARGGDNLQDLIVTAFPYVYDTDTIAENIERIRDYSEDLIPVISHNSNKILGVITASDIAELIDEELAEDYAKLAALGGEEEPNEPLRKSIRLRVPWLSILLFMGLAVSYVVGLFEGIVARLPILVAFQSLILGMAGNAGTQSLAVTVRSIGSTHNFTPQKRIKAVFRETRIAFYCGIVLGTIAFLTVLFTLALSGEYSPYFFRSVAGCVAVAMCLAMTVSGFTGATIPIVLSSLGVDPAVASGPLITTINDLVAVLGYYGLSAVMLHTIL